MIPSPLAGEVQGGVEMIDPHFRTGDTGALKLSAAAT